ncbi:putative uncharacterized protein [Prevotella sp. CAG:1031]|nr:putative uncharacterized protein [Prevotella sp. CAG:1031]
MTSKTAKMILCAALLAAGTTACGPKKSTATAVSQTSQATFMPQALAYKTNAPALDNVPVTLNDARTSIVSFPAPTDINEKSRPLPLEGGWLLDRRGISPNSAFTNYTYQRYAVLPHAPSTRTLLEAVMPDIRVTDIISLPMKIGEATVATANEAIRKGNYKVVYHANAE